MLRCPACCRVATDCSNVTDFFRKNGVTNVLTVRELFEFIVDPSLSADVEDEYLLKVPFFACPLHVDD